MKKEYLIIGAVVLTIGYFVWRNNQKSNKKNLATDKGFPYNIDVKKLKIDDIGRDIETFDKYDVWGEYVNGEKDKLVSYILYIRGNKSLYARYDLIGNFESLNEQI
jgi:hypothetical protein